jgi:glycosyltransferase involved in cell wall biosynthesis
MPFNGGIELVTYDLARAVADLGHEVTMIAAHGSEKNSKYSLYEVTGGNQSFDDEQRAYNEYQDILGAFDIVSDHTHSHFVYMAKMLYPDITIQTTRHSQWGNMPPPKSANPNVPAPEPKPYNFCGISNFHSRECSGLSGMVFKTLYDGIDLDRYPYQEEKGDRLLYVGRMEPFKGAHWAVSVAVALRMPLDLIGKDHDTNQEFVASLKRDIEAAKQKGHEIQYLGETDLATKLKYLKNAYALLFPALWSEPLGLVPLEAAACGTPCIATVNGALPEVIKHGSTGWLATNIDEMAELTTKAPQIRPKDCRDWVTERFSKEVMANAYVSAWRQVLDGKGW